MRGQKALTWVANAVEPESNPAGAVYGTITTGALLAAESIATETTPDAVGAVVLALLVYWLAHAYADALGERLEHDRPFRLRGLLLQLRRSASILRGSILPLTGMLVAWAAGAQSHVAVLVGLFSAASSLVLLELIAAVRSRCSSSELLTQAAVSILLGLGILGLKVLLH